MAGFIDFSQIFSEEYPISKKKCTAVPDAPVFQEFADISTDGRGDCRESLRHLRPQWLSSTPNTRDGGRRSDQVEEKATERGACDDVLLGSQYPLVHKVGPSKIQRILQDHADCIVPTEISADQGTKPSLPQRYSKIPYNRFEITPVPINQRREQSYHQQKQQQQFISQSRQQPQNQHDEDDFQQQSNNVDSQEDMFDSDVPSTGVSGSIKLNTIEFPDNTTRFIKSPDCGAVYTPGPLNVPSNVQRLGIRLRSVTEIPERYRTIFNFPHFNVVQSKVFDNVLYSDKSLVLCSPTGSGKTAVLEMAIVRLLTSINQSCVRNLKIVYMAPIKALCSEKYNDWREKFEGLGLRVMELTGDTDTDDFYELQQVNIILTTPEKWDSMTRKWRENKSVMQAICLFIVDEIHILNDTSRGAVVEAVISRMKMIQATRDRSSESSEYPPLRFIALSATITNIEDLAQWMGSHTNPALQYKLDERFRPVRLRKVVLGYHFLEGKQSEFQFDISLSYKLAGIIHTYSDDKPTLVFCATRKGAMQGAEILAKDMKGSFVHSGQHKLDLQNHSFNVKDTKLRDLLCKGIGYHHAGMDVQDRRLIEDIFTRGSLPVLVATSTLAMGVNLPAHLVIVKSTMYYNMGSHVEYPDTQVLQMIGRAGRPQFDTSATAVIMTKNQTKMKYENLMNGTQLIESSLHKNLVEHLNAEIVLNTVTDISVALEWLKYTFLYIRVMKNPRHYGMPSGLSTSSIEKRLQGMCMNSLKQLASLQLIHMNEENMDVKSTDSGRLVARYCVSCKTAELFMGIKGMESVNDLLSVMSKCEEFADIKLRNNEKKTLNTLNRDKNRITIRYPLTGKIKTTEMKVNCLIQVTLGSLMVQDFGLQQDASRIFRAGVRVSRCLVELLWQRNEYECLVSALQLCKCFKAKLWEDSKYVSKQLDGIGPALSTALVNAGLINFQKLEETNPREIELIVNRHPPFGNQVRDGVAKLPKYELAIEQVSKYSTDVAEIVITVQLTNRDIVQEFGTTRHTCTLIVGDEDNKVIYKQRIVDALLIRETSWSKKLEVRQAGKGPDLFIHYISLEWVGLDVECTYTPNYLGGKRITSSSNHQMNDSTPVVIEDTVPCNHQCHNKRTCNHDCCKFGVSAKRRSNKCRQQTPRGPQGAVQTPKGPQGVVQTPRGPQGVVQTPRGPQGAVQKQIEQLKHWSSRLPQTPSLGNKRPMQQINSDNFHSIDLSRFAYTLNGSREPLSDNVISDQLIETTNHSTGPCDQQSTVGSRELGTRPTGQHDKPGTNNRKNTVLPELNMFMKLRENARTEQLEDESEDFLPDIEMTTQNLGPQQGPQQGLEQEWASDFGQETDYGYTYVHSQDQTDVPANWDDKLDTHRQQTRHHNQLPPRNQYNPVAAGSHSRQSVYKPTERTNPYTQKHNPRCHSPIPATGGGNNRNIPESNPHEVYDIEDFSSDESFEAAAQNLNHTYETANRNSDRYHAELYRNTDHSFDTVPIEQTRVQSNRHDGRNTHTGHSFDNDAIGQTRDQSNRHDGRNTHTGHSFDNDAIGQTRDRSNRNDSRNTNTGQYFDSKIIEQPRVQNNRHNGRSVGQSFDNETIEQPRVQTPRHIGPREDYEELFGRGQAHLNAANTYNTTTKQHPEYSPASNQTLTQNSPPVNKKRKSWWNDIFQSIDNTASIGENKTFQTPGKSILKNSWNLNGSEYARPNKCPKVNIELNGLEKQVENKMHNDRVVVNSKDETADDEMDHVNYGHDEVTDGQGSKWCNYINSQSSTASECLNWQYPAQNENNQVVMKRYGDENGNLNKDNKVLDEFGKNNTAESFTSGCSKPGMVPEVGTELPLADDRRTRKYGQVLAWVSNPENQSRSSHGEKLVPVNSKTGLQPTVTPGSTATECSTVAIKENIAPNRTDDKNKNFQFSSLFRPSKTEHHGDPFNNIFKGLFKK